MRNDIIFGIGVFLAVAFISGLSLYYAAPPGPNMKQVHDGENVYSYFDQSDFLKFTSYDGGYGCVMGGDFIADSALGSHGLHYIPEDHYLHIASLHDHGEDKGQGAISTPVSAVF